MRTKVGPATLHDLGRPQAKFGKAAPGGQAALDRLRRAGIYQRRQLAIEDRLWSDRQSAVAIQQDAEQGGSGARGPDDEALDVGPAAHDPMCRSRTAEELVGAGKHERGIAVALDLSPALLQS